MRPASGERSIPASRPKSSRSVLPPIPLTSSLSATPVARSRSATSTRPAPPVSATTPSTCGGGGTADWVVRCKNQTKPPAQHRTRVATTPASSRRRVRPIRVLLNLTAGAATTAAPYPGRWRSRSRRRPPAGRAAPATAPAAAHQMRLELHCHRSPAHRRTERRASPASAGSASPRGRRQRHPKRRAGSRARRILLTM